MKFLHHSYKKSSNKVATDISTSGGFWGKYDVGELYLNIRADSLHPMWRTCGNVKRFLDDVEEIWLLFTHQNPKGSGRTRYVPYLLRLLVTSCSIFRICLIQQQQNLVSSGGSQFIKPCRHRIHTSPTQWITTTHGYVTVSMASIK